MDRRFSTAVEQARKSGDLYLGACGKQRSLAPGTPSITTSMTIGRCWRNTVALFRVCASAGCVAAARKGRR